MAVLAGKEGAEHQLFAGAGVQFHFGVGGDIADVAQQQDGLAVLTVIELLAALERVFGIVCQARLVDEQGGIRVLREDAVQVAPAIRCHDPVILRDVIDEAPQIPQIGLAVQHLLHIGGHLVGAAQIQHTGAVFVLPCQKAHVGHVLRLFVFLLLGAGCGHAVTVQLIFGCRTGRAAALGRPAAACKADGQRQQGCQKFQSFHKFSFLMPCRGAPQGAAPGVGCWEKSSTPSTGTGRLVSAESCGFQSSGRPVLQ